MTRRFWPAALAAVSILVFASYLVYTQYIVRQIQAEAEIHAQIIGLVQQGLLQLASGVTTDAPVSEPSFDTETGRAALALVELQEQVQRLNVPIVVFNIAGEPQSANNLPFEWDLSTPEGRWRVQRYAAELRSRYPDNFIQQAGAGEIYFGDPPILKWLRWVPYLQVGAGILLILIAYIVMRADMRAHREQLWSAMARELAHQMGTPLSSLSGWVEVLQLTAVEREAMASTERIGRLMQADVERLERVSRRFELIGKPQTRQTVAVADLMEELVRYFVPRLPHLGKGILLRARTHRDLPQLRANPVLLVWALENIIKNAIDALAGRGGRISVLALPGERPAGVGAQPISVHIIIADNGPGIAASVRDRIFEPGVTTKSSGWGVGLSLSRRIIEELHHGRIRVEHRKGGGTVFDVMLPVVKT